MPYKKGDMVLVDGESVPQEVRGFFPASATKAATVMLRGGEMVEVDKVKPAPQAGDGGCGCSE